MFVVTGTGLAESAEVRLSSDKKNRDSLLVQMAVLSIRKALMKAGWNSYPLPADLNAGITCLTPSGEGQTEAWAYKVQRGRLRAHPREFGGLIHNSAAGRAAIQFGLIGPQVVVISGDVLHIAKLQLFSNRTKLMVVCATNEIRTLAREQKLITKQNSLEYESIAFSLIIEYADETPINSAHHCVLSMIESSICNDSTDSDIDIFWRQWSLATNILQEKLYGPN